MSFILSCLYFFVPAYFTNMVPPLLSRAKLLKFLNRRVDFGKKYNGIPILGSHKTWRGVIGGVLVGILIVFLQSYLFKFSFFKEISLINYHQISSLGFGFLISLGAVVGDLLFSFFKRRHNLKPGQPWIPWDQIDFVVGAFLVVTPVYSLSISVWVVILTLTFFLHVLVNHIGFWLNISQSKL